MDTYSDFFSGHTQSLPDHSFSIEQFQSLQNIFMAYHAYAFRCVYDMETHLESLLEEMKIRQSRTERTVAQLFLELENAKSSQLALSKEVDGGSPYKSSRKHSTGDSLDFDFSPDSPFHATPAVNAICNFASVPSVSSTISPATWTPTATTTAGGEQSDDDMLNSSIPYDQDSSDDEEIVAMQLFPGSESIHSPSSPLPVPPSSSPSPPDLPMLTPSSPWAPSPPPPHSQTKQIHESESEPTPKPALLELPLSQALSHPLAQVQDQPPLSSFYNDLLCPLSPLSDLTDTSFNTELGPLSMSSCREEKWDAGNNESELTITMSDPLSEVLTSVSPSAGTSFREEERKEKKRLKRKRKRATRTKVDHGLKLRISVARRTGERRGGSKKARVVWPEMYEGDDEDEFYSKLIECDMCLCWYHYGCAGITPGDVRLNDSEIYVCPMCSTIGENKVKNKETCSRPNCGRNTVQPGEFFVAGVAGRRFRYDEENKVQVEYLVRWDGYMLHEATWEEEKNLPNPHKLVEEFEEMCRKEGIVLGTPDPILLNEAVKAGWGHVLALTDPPGEKVTLKHATEQKLLYWQGQLQG